jgi:hypothetical protein
VTVTEVLGGLGSWQLVLVDGTPRSITDQIDYFGHIVIVPGQIDVEATGQGLLTAARYVGVLRAKGKGDARQMAGSGMLFWLGDEDDKGAVFETEVDLVSKTLLQAVTAVKPASVALGTVYPQTDPAARYDGKHVFQSPRKALEAIADAFGAEIRVNGDGTLDVGTQAQLYATAPRQDGQATPIITRAPGSDIDLLGVPGAPAVEEGAYDFTTDVVLVGQTIGSADEPSQQFAVGRKTATSVPYVDIFGHPVKFTRVISESGETVGSVDARATLQLNRFNRLSRALALHAGEYEATGDFAVGDLAYVYDPDTGITDYARELIHAGERIWPDVIRVSGMTWPVTRGHTVAYRTGAGVWLDLTPYVTWETSGTDIVVGDLPKSLTRPSDPLQDRVDAARGVPSTKQPKTPTGLALSTTSSPNAKGWDSAVITASWNPVTQYVDNSNVALDHYELQYRPQFRSPLWTASFVTTSLAADLPVTAALGYDVQVRAVSTGGIPSDWSSPVSIISAADSTGPATPSDPVVTPYLGLLRIYWNGLSAVGGPMPADFNRVDVHVGTSSGFTPSAATLVSSLSAAGYAHTQAPYGSARFVRFIAYDHNGNPSAASATASGTAVQANDGDIAALSVGKLTAGTISADVVMAGRFATALTGARREVNAVGFQAFDASNNLLVNLDGVNNLLTGIFQTALPGSRRIVAGAAGAAGEIDFYAPDGTLAYIHAYTESTGVEAMQMGIPKAGGDGFWNKIHFNSDEWMNLHANKLDFNYLTGGFFIVRQLSARSGGTVTPRILADSNNVSLRGPDGTTCVLVDSNSNVTLSSTSSTTFSPNNNVPTRGAIQFLGGGTGGAANSAYILFQTSQVSGGGVFLGGLVYNANTDGSQFGLAACNSDNSAYIPMKASAFNVLSDRAAKEEIADVDSGFLAEIAAMQPRKYRRKHTSPRHRLEKLPDGTWVDNGPDADYVPPVMPEEIGFLAQEMPVRFVSDDPLGKTLDLYQLVVAAIGGLQELAAIVERGKP